MLLIICAESWDGVESVPSNSEDCEKFDAFDKLLPSIVDHEIFERRKNLDMKNLLEKHHEILREGFQQAYRSDKLKSCLEKTLKR